MQVRSLGKRFRFIGAAILVLLFANHVAAQSGTGTVHGQVTDPSGAAVPNATVQVIDGSQHATATTTGRDGSYEVKGLAPGSYTVRANAAGFDEYQSAAIEVAAGRNQKLDLPLSIHVEQQKVEVSADSGSQLSVSPENNAGAIVLSGKDLDQLSDDPDQLQSDLEALAGPSVGPQWGPDVHRRIHGRATSAEILHP